MAKSKKYPNQFKINDIKSGLDNLEPMTAYSFNKRNQPKELNQVLSFLPNGYSSDLKNKIQSVDFIYSGSTEQPFILGFFVGRLDSFKGQETYDIDFFHIAPESGSVDDYFMEQFHHFKDDNGERLSTNLNSSLIISAIDKENQLYNVYLTGSTTGSTFEEYEQSKPTFINLFRKSFK